MKQAAFAIFLLATTNTSHAQSGNSVPVTVDNFARAESDLYMLDQIQSMA